MSSVTNRSINAAAGYFDLGMYTEAHEALAGLPPADAMDLRVLALREKIYRKREDWEGMHIVALMLCEGQPDNPQWPLSTAFAIRHLRGPARAIGILMEATEQFPNEAAVYYDLACCEALCGNVDLARGWLNEAYRLAPELGAAARVDVDLAALR